MYAQHFWGFPLYRLLDGKGRFLTLQPLSKTKLWAQACIEVED